MLESYKRSIGRGRLCRILEKVFSKLEVVKIGAVDIETAPNIKEYGN